jgi:DNA repair photolyase
MTGIYQPKGKAAEYCENAVNLYKGCEHGCIYCWSPRVTHQTRESFLKATPRVGIIEQIEKDAPKYRGQKVLLSFTSDPYQPINRYEQLTHETLLILLKHGITPVILTKGGLRSMWDFDILAKCNDASYGATLTFIEEEDSLKWEPKAAVPDDRIFVLRQAKKAGLHTWVSLEPVISPEQSLQLIKKTHDFVDIFKVGRWNYDLRTGLIDWRDFVKEAVGLFKKYKLNYYIKRDLERFI